MLLVVLSVKLKKKLEVEVVVVGSVTVGQAGGVGLGDGGLGNDCAQYANCTLLYEDQSDVHESLFKAQPGIAELEG